MPTLPHLLFRVMFPKKRMMSETYYPMNHVSWGCSPCQQSPGARADKETQFDGLLVDRSTSVGDLRSADPSGDSGFGEHAPETSSLSPPPSSSSGDARRDDDSSRVTEDAGAGAAAEASAASSGDIYSEIASPGDERRRFCREDEIVHLSEEPLTATGADDDGDLERGVVTSERGVRRPDAVDGPSSMAHDPDDSCAMDCLYYTLKCCDCRII
ncbi:uncharacterized protein LOC134533345 [Bacillus rossius redtenbacheri]|uniref:uncharacterized protein LOC134533345 n=1 Tax=Bacillus rossius redtenbacheri TaxID=93214 RepID=UPI002FDE56B4